MKKTYISPEFIAVELRCNHMLAESIGVNRGVTIDSEADGGWVKENYPPINDKNVWDDEW